MSGWSLVAVIVAAPLAIVAGLVGAMHAGMAGLWLRTRTESPSPIPLVGFVLPPILVLLSFAIEPEWVEVATLGAAVLGVGGELALLAARAINALRKRASRPPA